jgi:hypothetical protein
MSKKTGLRCYVCGNPCEDKFYLVAMSEPVDRVFIVHEGEFCFSRIEDGSLNVAVYVQVTKPR